MTPKYTILDISKYNIINDYTAAASNIGGVIIRAGYRSYSKGILTKDKLFDKHIVNFSNLGTNIGVYFFTTAITEKEAIEEADYTVNLIKPYNIVLPIFVDSEYSNKWYNGRSDKISKALRTKCAVAFCNRIKELRYEAGVYASDSWFKTHLEYNQVNKFKIWVASYSRAPRFVPKEYAGWQYTSKGKVNGIPNRVDLSYWYEGIITKPVKKIEEKPVSINGTKLELKNTNIYKKSTDTEPSNKINGTYYIWNNKVYNDKIRITYSEESVGNIKNIAGWVLYSDIKHIVDPPKDQSKVFKTGSKVELSNVKLFRNTKPETMCSRLISGTYYIWSDAIVNNRVRITNNPDNIGDINKVTGWVNWAEISNLF